MPRRIHFFAGFALVLLALVITRCANPSIFQRVASSLSDNTNTETEPAPADSITQHAALVEGVLYAPRKAPMLLDPKGQPLKHRIVSVPDFEEAFPDLNDVQVATAAHEGINTVADREAAAREKSRLVYVGDNPFFYVDNSNYSIPYLTPRAAALLDEIGRSFTDSLMVKGLPALKLVVTSVLRTEADVERLRKRNQNASANSCHRYGTTFDIAYERFVAIDETGTHQIRYDAQSKRVLAEVMNDLRRRGLCYVKYEVHQTCFHITAR